MKISLLQPEIIRGDIDHNIQVIQKLMQQSQGELLVLPEYALTGSLVLDPDADVREWAARSAQAKAQLNVPEGKYLLLNSLVSLDGEVFNCCELLPTQEHYCKISPDETELDADIRPGNKQKVFELSGKRFKVVICHDFKRIAEIATDTVDFVLFVFHFTESNILRVGNEVKHIAEARGTRFLISSLVSDKNIGHSAYVTGDATVALSNKEGILEVELA